MQYRFGPIALFNKTAATVESTPPESPKTTLSFPSFYFNSATISSAKAFGVKFCGT